MMNEICDSLLFAFFRVVRGPIFFFLIASLLLACWKPEENPASNITAIPARNAVRQELRDNIAKIAPFFAPMGEPGPYDWLASYKEPGQTFEQYLDSNPTKPTTERRKLYVIPLGTFTAQQKKVIEITAGYLEAFYSLPVSTLPTQAIKRPLSVKDSRRNLYTVGAEQIRAGYLMDEVLKPILPADAAALIAFTSDDLYPDETMYYVFGQASLADRVGVWSLARLDYHANFDTFLRRTIKIAAHETGHMFSMLHCAKYECLMSGTNHLGETDRRPIDACPECTAKICWLSDADQHKRYERLASFCRENGLTKEAGEFARKAAALDKTRITALSD